MRSDSIYAEASIVSYLEGWGGLIFFSKKKKKRLIIFHVFPFCKNKQKNKHKKNKKHKKHTKQIENKKPQNQ